MVLKIDSDSGEEENDVLQSRMRWMRKEQLTQLMFHLRQAGFLVKGPRLRDEAIVYDDIEAIDDLPQGVRDRQAAGQYRVDDAGHDNYFEFNVGPHSCKQFLFPARETVARAERHEDGWTFEDFEHLQAGIQESQKLAVIGVRACELAAIAIQDRVFLGGDYVDPGYRQRREALFIVAVNCTVANANCFCTSMDTGPKCTEGFDLALVELESGFLVDAASQAGEQMLEELETRPASKDEIQEASRLQQRAVEQISKRMDTDGIRDVLLDNLEHPHWDSVADRCLSCTNCTMVCPTCFCSTVSEVSDLQGDRIERVREWDSCFNLDFSYTRGGTVRNDRRSRFRQWLTHKLASWQDQFGTSGCVGCGRCISWCPVGIDLTEEVATLRETPTTRRTLPSVAARTTAACDVKEAQA
jgi:ferredoxin